jgi:hypothetical protein
MSVPVAAEAAAGCPAYLPGRSRLAGVISR